jgi:hypothetical protein
MGAPHGCRRVKFRLGGASLGIEIEIGIGLPLGSISISIMPPLSSSTASAPNSPPCTSRRADIVETIVLGFQGGPAVLSLRVPAGVKPAPPDDDDPDAAPQRRRPTLSQHGFPPRTTTCCLGETCIRRTGQHLSRTATSATRQHIAASARLSYYPSTCAASAGTSPARLFVYVVPRAHHLGARTSRQVKILVRRT